MERFDVERKAFQVKFEGINGGMWFSITERSRGFVVSLGFGEEELDWLLEHLKKAVELEAFGGFTRKIRGKTRTHLMEICFNSRGRFMKITEIVAKRKSLVLVVPEGVKGNGWETLRKAISRVQDVSDQAVRASKEKDKESQVNKGMYREGRSYADVVAEKGHRNGASMTVGRWARAVICESKGKILDWFDVGKVIARMMGTKGMVSVTPISEYKGCFFVDSARRAMWFQDQGSVTVRGGVVALRRWSPKENSVVGGKFRRGWLELRGLPFHLWDEYQLRYILQKWGRVTKVAKETLKLVDLSKVKMWVEMHPNVVLPALLEVEDGAWSFTVAVSVIGEAEEDVLSQASVKSQQGRSNVSGRWRPRHRSRARSSVSNSDTEVEKGRGKSCLGPMAASVDGPTEPEAFFKGRFARAHFEEKNIGPSAGPVHETEAGYSNGGPATPSSSKLQRSGTSAKEVMPIAHSQESAKLKGNLVTARRKARSWLSSLKKNPDDSPGGQREMKGSRHATGRLVGVSRSEGVEFPLETSNRNSEDWPLFKDSLSSPEKLCVSGKDPSPNPEPPILPLEDFQVEGLTPGKMVKVQSVLESLRIRIVRENGKGAEEENQSNSFADKILSWNTRGLGSKKKRRIVRRFLSTQNPNIVMLQETKRETWDRRFVSSVWTGRRVEWVALPACGASGGIVILWDSSKFECTEKVLGSFSVTVKFNSGRVACLTPPLRNAAFTWSNMQADPICKRLDRFLFSSEWDTFFSQSFQEALPRWTSDHSPICLETNPLKWGPTPFRFENMWLLHPEFKEKFRVWWQECTSEGWEGHKFMRKLKFVKLKLKEWNIMTFGDLKERKKLILTDLSRIDLIEQEGNLNPDLVLERTLRRKELEDVLLKEEVQWRQKSRVKWIKEGDCNSKFFHRVATGRRSRKFIKSLISERGETLNNIEDIYEEIVNFFGNLYSKPVGESWRVEGIDWVPISGESGVWLDRSFTEEEVRMAVFQLNKEKAPGPDGFTIAVYQECWDVIKEDLTRVFLEFHTNGVINQSTNVTFIALVPKKSQSFKISDYRPISLVTSLYKIIAKVLSGRLRKVLHETISGSQGAFVEGRYILDAVLIANEVVDEKRRSGEEGIVFKIDFEKAYDHVDWGFLDHVLQRKGFSQKWRSWIRGCLSSSSFAILVNGNAKGWVKASRGLRQGDPFSPFLFTLVADVLNDTIFFSKASMEHLQNLKIILLVFGQVSGLKINLEKSTISGLPLGGNPKTIGFWDPVVERISRRLDGWKKAYLSLGGRITLIQSCLSHIPSYFLSLFKIPASIASRIEKMQRNFLWSGAGEGKKDHLVRWEVVSRPKESGGLGFGKISLRNIALLGKWLWRLPRERSGLWHKVIVSIYGTHPNGWDANMVVRWSHRCPWKVIAQVFQEFSPFVRLVVGNGERIRFWEDLWWGNQSLCSQFADLYRVISVKNLTVSNVLGNSFPLAWNLNFRRNLTDSEIDLLQRLMSSLSSVRFSPSLADSRAWSLSSSGPRLDSSSWKVNTNDKLQLRRPYKSLCPQWCILCKGNGESIDHLFLHCPVTIGLWNKLFKLAGLVWVPPRSFEDMLVIAFKGLGNSLRGKTLWQVACLTLVWIVWQERNNRIFEDKGRSEETLWDLILFYSTLWASCSAALEEFL
ncbi:Transposon TX1 uncharacterized 149 kDa protein [Vitis vinifera]|uniref:Transposon TX1 uncharacterized 149 kDa protein n=1 Tax=Vitis vinifera TaxID=29760 RepID=A0A438IJB1_VITVI|nr:Transposon TX1 uncharacterized 149 kDa protein [Vitis vinifera]